MKKLQLQAFLMVATILVIAGFQLFWLNQTYEKEKDTLAVKTDLLFSNAIEDLQVAKLRLDKDSGFNDTTQPIKIKMLTTDEIDHGVRVRYNKKKGVLSMVNVISKSAKDSSKRNAATRTEIIFTDKKTLFNKPPDTGENKEQKQHEVFRFLSTVDSLQDSLKISEIDSAFSRKLLSEKIDISFSVSKADIKLIPREQSLHEVGVGFANPVMYRLNTTHTLPYLLKQMLVPILFSILLMGITILSFVVLYRNLLRQRRLTAIKNEFIGNITHELKTPISTVSVAIEAMKNFNALQNPERTQEYLNIAGMELNRLSMLVDKVLRLSMFENKQVELKYQAFDFSELVREVLKSMQLQVEKLKANVSLELKGIDFTIEADRMHLSSVIYNLVDNALKYGNEHPVIKLSAETTDKEITLIVSDDGIGIDPVYKDKVFEKFFRIPQGNMHNVKGYGLGLSYAAYIVERHEGKISVESDGKKGSSFIIKIPRQHAS